MNKFETKFILALVSFLCVSLVGFAGTYTKFSRGFMKNFRDCNSYKETITSEFEGETFVTERSIKGWSNSHCMYEEVIKARDSKYKILCAFSSVQVDELSDAMKSKSNETINFPLDTFTEEVDEKTGRKKFVKSGTTQIAGNKAYIVWAKYQNNPYFCRPERLY